MIDALTPGDRERLVDLVKLIVGAAAPEIIKVVAASREGVSVHAVGELLSIEPTGQRDYRKEVWIKAFMLARRASDADDALRFFDDRFPP
jgi:hypothetical protein